MRWRRTQALSVVLLALGLPAVARAQQSEVDPLIGCYQLELGSWNPALHAGNALYQTPPEAFRLTSELGDEVFEKDRLLVRPRIPHGRMPSAYWERLDTDSLRVIWTNGLAGVRLHFRINGELLEGVAQTFTDVSGGPPPPQAEAVAKRKQCEGSSPA